MNTFYLSFDDTDNLQSPGTGHLLSDFLHSNGIDFGFISRHQLFVSAAVPYTSHNSAMCTVVDTNLEYEALISLAARYLEAKPATGADPGLCVADPKRMTMPESLVNWGYLAKREVVTKEGAYELAERCGVHLSEHGGTGQGIVGALAAVGLRLAGNDGRVKGKKTVPTGKMTVRALLDATHFQRVSCIGTGELPEDAVIRIPDPTVKAVYQNFASTILVTPCGGEYELLPKNMVKCF